MDKISEKDLEDSTEKKLETERVEADSSQLEAGAFNKLGLSFVHAVFSVSKMVQIYNLRNNAVRRAIADFLNILNDLFKLEGRAVMRLAAEYLNINDVRITVDSQHFGPFLYLMDEMKKREVESIEFAQGVTATEVGNFFKAFFESEEGDEPFEKLEKALSYPNLPNISITQLIETERCLKEYSESKIDVKLESNRIFFRTVALMREIVKAIEERHSIQVKKAKRLTQQMADIIQTDESILLGLTNIKNFDEYTFTHSVNVCILAMAMGDRLRLCKGDIARLGLAALFHDIGKLYVPESIVNNPKNLSGREWELMKYHTFFGVKELAKVKALKEVTDAMFVSLQHHVHYNMNGYPRKEEGWQLRLFSRIVTIADYYDAMTSPRVYRKSPISPDKVISFIFNKSGEIFDPFITKVFIYTMGFYPVGTAVLLDTGEKGIVVKPKQEQRYLHRPHVKLLGIEDSDEEAIVDLAQKNPDTGQYCRTITGSIPSEELVAEKDSTFLVE